jgi:hypothetical protein
MADPLQMLKELESSPETEDGAYSREELEAIWGCAECKARKILKQLDQQGKVEIVYRRITTVSKVNRKVKVYKFVEPEKKRSKR